MTFFLITRLASQQFAHLLRVAIQHLVAFPFLPFPFLPLICDRKMLGSEALMHFSRQVFNDMITICLANRTLERRVQQRLEKAALMHWGTARAR